MMQRKTTEPTLLYDVQRNPARQLLIDGGEWRHLHPLFLTINEASNQIRVDGFCEGSDDFRDRISFY